MVFPTPFGLGFDGRDAARRGRGLQAEEAPDGLHVSAEARRLWHVHYDAALCKRRLGLAWVPNPNRSTR